MAVRVLPAGTIGIPLNPTPDPEPPPPSHSSCQTFAQVNRMQTKAARRYVFHRLSADFSTSMYG